MSDRPTHSFSQRVNISDLVQRFMNYRKYTITNTLYRNEKDMPCKICGGTTDDGHDFCEQCIEDHTRTFGKDADHETKDKKKGIGSNGDKHIHQTLNSDFAAALSFFLPGVGQIYGGRTDRGIAFIIAAFLLVFGGGILFFAFMVTWPPFFIILLMLMLGLMIISSIDAANVVKEHNSYKIRRE